MDLYVDWSRDPEDDDDITTWPVERLDELGVLAFDGVEGVELDEIGPGDEIPDHGVNTADQQVLPPPPEEA